MNFVAPLPIRKLRAEMAIKALRIGEVAARAGVRLSRASEVLGGKRNDPETLHKLRRVIEAAKMPKEVEA